MEALCWSLSNRPTILGHLIPSHTRLNLLQVANYIDSLPTGRESGSRHQMLQRFSTTSSKRRALFAPKKGVHYLMCANNTITHTKENSMQVVPFHWSRGSQCPVPSNERQRTRTAHRPPSSPRTEGEAAGRRSPPEKEERMTSSSISHVLHVR